MRDGVGAVITRSLSFDLRPNTPASLSLGRPLMFDGRFVLCLFRTY